MCAVIATYMLCAGPGVCSVDCDQEDPVFKAVCLEKLPHLSCSFAKLLWSTFCPSDFFSCYLLVDEAVFGGVLRELS